MEQEAAAMALVIQLPLRLNSTSDLAFPSRAALPLRNVCITKTQICYYSIPPAPPGSQYTAHTHTHKVATIELFP